MPDQPFEKTPLKKSPRFEEDPFQTSPPAEEVPKTSESVETGSSPTEPIHSSAEKPDCIGRYRVLSVLGEGGFGCVYLARDDELDRAVAIKVPHRERISSPGDMDSYLAEARILAGLDHPNIVPVHDLGRTDDGLCFVVSKYIEGGNLAARIKEKLLSWEESVRLVITIAEALHYAHRQGLVHRDVKPANILIDTSGRPFVVDFGLALKEQDFGRGSRSAGTPAYMSPEQAKRQGHRVDGRSDIFSLGVIFYELLTGKRPFVGQSIAELLEHITGAEPRPPRQHDDALPRELERICLKALSKNVTDRYTTAKDMADELRQFLLHGEQPARALAAVGRPAARVFISYRREDSQDVTDRIFDRLLAHFGKDSVFMDIATVPFGVDFRRHLADTLGQCDVILAIIGRSWADSRCADGPRQGQRRLEDPGDFVHVELQIALAQDIPIIPVLVGGASMPGAQHLPVQLKAMVDRNAAEVRSGRDFHGDVDRLIRGIEELAQNSGPSRTGAVQLKAGDCVTNSLGMRLAWIPPGSFLMGSAGLVERHWETEAKAALLALGHESQHRVTLSQGFYMAIQPVTRSQFAEFARKASFKTQAEREGGTYRWAGTELQLDPGANWRAPGFEQSNNDPAVCLSWHDCIAFNEWLSALEQATYRLPAEAEWEYACRAGTTTAFSTGEGLTADQANFDKRFGKTTPVGNFPANTWGLYDMHGNVWEWCQDWYGEFSRDDVTDPQGPGSGTEHVLRGGSFLTRPASCRSAYRYKYKPSLRDPDVGFRPVRVTSSRD